MKKVFMPWFDSLNKVYQLAMIAVFVIGLIGSIGGVVSVISLNFLDSRIHAQIQPVADMTEYLLVSSGKYDEYIKYKMKKEMDKKALGLTARETESWKGTN